MSTAILEPDLISAAERAVQLAQSSPEQAQELAAQVLATAGPISAYEALAIAERALGRAAELLENMDEAWHHLAKSLQFARRAGNELRTADARMGLALVLAEVGRAKRALRELDLAEASMRGDPRKRGHVRNQRAVVLLHLGRYEEAVQEFGRAAAMSRRAMDDDNLLRVYVGRGVTNGRLGLLNAGERDLRRAGELAARLGHSLSMGIVAQNLGWLAALRGDVVKSLSHYEQARKVYPLHCANLGSLLLDRSSALLAARLAGEAVDAAREAVDAFGEGQATMAQTEARLAVAEASLLAGEYDEARSVAQAAERDFVRQGRRAWTAKARYAALRASALAQHVDPGPLQRSALRVARGLDANGLHDEALDARILAARLALDAGNVAVARRELASAAAARRRGTVERRTRAWHAEALLRLSAGERARARSALRTGLRIFEEHRAMLGATDLRAAASSHRIDIARLGFSMALDDARPMEALSWVERSRAGLVRLATIRPPLDKVLGETLVELREILGEIEQAVGSGRSIAGLRARQQDLERLVRDRCRMLPPGSPYNPAAPPEPAALAARLSDRALVEFVEHEGHVYSVTLVAGRASVLRLALLTAVQEAARALRLMLNRVARNWGTASSRRQSHAGIIDHAARLDAMLLEPLRVVLAERPVVLVPTAAVRSVPWSLLPTCSGRPVSIAPSATVWFEASDTPAVGGTGSSPRRVVIAAGPGLPSAHREARILADEYPSSQILTGAAAAVAPTLSALDGAALAHIAGHGEFRADNPLFSSVTLADGPLTVYDLEGLAHAPDRVVLSACDSARDSMRTGDEMLGLAAAFLSLGTRVLIASLVSLPDVETTELMVDLHARLRSGEPPATALVGTQRIAAHAEPHVAAAAAALVCFGAG